MVAELESAKSKLTSEGGTLGTQVEEAEHKIGLLQKNNKTLDAHLNEVKSELEDETRAKADAQHKLQQALAELEQMHEQLEDEQRVKAEVQAKLSKAASEASTWRNKYESEGASRVEELEEAK